MPLKKARAEKLCEFWVFSFLCIFSWFLLLTFVRFLKAGINKFEISIKFCVFLIPILIFFKKKNFLGHNSTFCNLKMQMRKKLYIFKHFAKSKKLFFANIYHSPCDSYCNSKKSRKLKPPKAQSQKIWQFVAYFFIY